MILKPFLALTTLCIASSSLCTATAIAQVPPMAPPPGIAPPPGFVPPLQTEAPLPTRTSQPRIDFANGVSALPGLTYKRIDGYRPLKLDLYLPPETAAPGLKPMVVYVHGGGWRAGDPQSDFSYGDFTQVLAELSARGYVVVGVSYRFSAEAPFPAAVDDVRDAIAFMRQHAATWNIDPDKVVLWGASAGGNLVSVAGTNCASAACVQAVVDWFGPTTPRGNAEGMSGGLDSAYLGCKQGTCPPDLIRKASALTYVSAKSPPFLIMHGAADNMVPVDQSQALADALKAKGVDVDLQIFPGLGHGFVGASNAQKRQFLDTVFAFIDRVTTKPQP